MGKTFKQFDRFVFWRKPYRRLSCLVVFFAVFSVVVLVKPYGTACFGGQDGLGTGGGFSDATRPVSSNTMGSMIEPVSSYQQSAFSASGYPSLSGNMLIMGSIGGRIPFGSTTGINSTSMNAFLHYSSGANEPFYSPYGSPLSVTGLGGTSFLNSPSGKVRGYDTGRGSILATFPMGGASGSAENISLWSSSYGLVTQASVGAQYQENLIGKVQGYGAPEQFVYGQGMAENDSFLKNLQNKERGVSTLETTSLDQILQPAGQKEAAPQQPEQKDISQQISEKIEELNKAAEDRQVMEEGNKKIEQAIGEQWKAKMDVGNINPKGRETKGRQGSNAEQQQTQTGLAPGTLEVVQQEFSERERERLGLPPREPNSSRGLEKLLLTKEDVEQKFNYHIAIGLKYLKEGKYYQAADSFTWATMYNPLSPAGDVCKAFALFAAGDYLSSARIVAIEVGLSADFVQKKSNLRDMLGSNVVEKRLADLEKKAQAGGSGELYFLLAFIHYQLGNQTQAGQAIEESVNKLPQDITVAALKKIIDAGGSSK